MSATCEIKKTRHQYWRCFYCCLVKCRHTDTLTYLTYYTIHQSTTNLCKSLLANFETRQRQRLVAKKRTWTAYFEIPQIYFTSSPVSLFFDPFALLATLATSRATRRINPKIQFQFRFHYEPHAGYQFQFAASTELAPALQCCVQIN